jgi:hypothetical protein
MVRKIEMLVERRGSEDCERLGWGGVKVGGQWGGVAEDQVRWSSVAT